MSVGERATVGNLLIMYRKAIFTTLMDNRSPRDTMSAIVSVNNDKPHVPRDKMRSLCKIRCLPDHYRRYRSVLNGRLYARNCSPQLLTIFA